jgi:NTE family protein
MITLGDHLDASPFDLALSAGFFGFFAHTGMLCALHEAGLRPVRLTGTSAGALVAGLYASGRSPRDIAHVLLAVRTADFSDPAPGLGLWRGRRFRGILERELAAIDFEGCARPVAVSAWDVMRRRVDVLATGDLAAAIHASCAFPGLLQPVRIGSRWYLDGGIGDRAALAGVPAGRRVFHHHLASRSPWRRAGDPSLEPPRRSGLVGLTIGGLPRVGPTRLAAGRVAFERAFEATRAALERPIVDGVVRMMI